MDNKLLTDIYHNVMFFYANSITGSELLRREQKDKNIRHVEKWIIDEEERKAFEIVLDVLKDCGASDK